MIFSAIKPDDGCTCAECGRSEFEGISTTIKRADGVYDLITICTRCLFTGGMKLETFNKALGKTTPPKPMPEPEPIKPRWFGK